MGGENDVSHNWQEDKNSNLETDKIQDKQLK